MKMDLQYTKWKKNTVSFNSITMGLIYIAMLIVVNIKKLMMNFEKQKKCPLSRSYGIVWACILL